MAHAAGDAGGRRGEKVAYARLFAGTIRARELFLGEKVTALAAFERGGTEQRQSVSAGEIAQLWGLTRVRIGDSVGAVPRSPALQAFARPTLETVVEAEDRHALKLALTQLAEQDPLIDVRQDESGTLSLSLYGEVQKEVVAATLAEEYDLAAEFRDTTMICVERPLGVGEALEILHTETNPFDATLGYRIEPAAPGSGLEFRLGVGAAVSPLHLYGKLELFAEDMERVVRETFEVGLHGWQVTDCVVTLAQTAYGVADGPPSKSSEPSSTCRPTASAPCSRRSAGPALRRPAARVAAPAARADLGHSASSRRVRTATGRCTGIRRCAAGRGRAR